MLQCKIISHADYSLAEREKLSATVLPASNVPHVLLATCNRTEAYWGTGDIPTELARHLYRVAAGIESALIGERAIQGQLRKAYLEAQEKYRLPGSLNRLFQSAIHVGKRVRNETHIAAGAVSHSQVTVEMLRQGRMDLHDKVIGIIGVNKLTEDILKFLTAHGTTRFFLSNRHLDKAQEMAARYGGTACTLQQKAEMLRQSAVVISATSSPHILIKAADLADRKEKEMLLFDLAFPRDIEPAAGTLPGVTLYNLEDIERFAQHNRRLRLAEVAKAEAIIAEEIVKLEQWQTKQHSLRTFNANPQTSPIHARQTQIQGRL